MRFHFFPLLAGILVGCAEEPKNPLEPAREAVRPWCEGAFSCGCEKLRWVDVEACLTQEAVSLVKTEAEAEALGLHFSEECFFQDFLGFGSPEEICVGEEAYQLLHPPTLSPGPFECGMCSPIFGDRQIGQTCHQFWYFYSDCAKGLFCLGEDETAKCFDICDPPLEGDLCNEDFDLCPPHFHCVKERCVQGPGLGEPCLEYGLCGPDLKCDETERCAVPPPLPKEGEPCEGVCEGEDIHCLSNETCGFQGGKDSPCQHAPLDCLPHLSCKEGFCQPLPGSGEPCEGPCDASLVCEDGFCQPESPLICEYVF